MRKKWGFICMFCFLTLMLFSHSGRTDAYGGHNNKKTGGYHYHNGGSRHAAANSYQNHNICGICNELILKEDIISVQRILKEKKFYSGEITGVINEESIVAIKRAQEKYGINQTGTITMYLLQKLQAN